MGATLIGAPPRKIIATDVPADVVAFIASDGYEPAFGARHLHRSIERHLLRLVTERGYSARTIDGYRRDLALLSGIEADRGWRAISQADLRRWIAQQTRSGSAPRSIARRLSAWRGFLDALAEQGAVDANPARGLRAPRAGKRLPKALSPDQALSLVQTAANSMWGTGVRINATSTDKSIEAMIVTENWR